MDEQKNVRFYLRELVEFVRERPWNQEHLLLDKTSAAKRLGVSISTFETMMANCELPPPLMGGKRPRWHIEQFSLRGIQEWQRGDKRPTRA